MKMIIVFLCFTLIAAVAHGQDSLSLNEVNVLGRKKTLKERAGFRHHAQTTEVLIESELNRNNPAFLEQSLGMMAGVQVDKRTMLGGQRIVIRGYGNDQKFNNWGVKAYYNTFPLTTADGITILDDLDFSVVNNIEVIKGPVATEYGSGIGGVARFYLKPSEVKGITLQETFNAGSFNLLQSNTRLDIVSDNAAMSLNYSHLQSDGYRTHGASLKNYLTYFSDFRFNPKQKLSVYFSHNYSFDEVSGQVSYADYYAGVDNGNVAYIKKNARNKALTTRVGISHTYKFTDNSSNTTSVFYANADYRRISAGAEENSNNPNFGLRSVFYWRRRLSDKFTNVLDAGVELQQSRALVTSYRFTGTNDTIPLQVLPIASGGSYFRLVTNQNTGFVHEKLTYSPWNVTWIVGFSVNGLNYRRTDLLAAPGLLTGYNKDISFEKTFTLSLNPHIALQKTWKGQIFNLSYSEGYNAPTSETTFIAGVNRTNDDLKPEKGRMIELAAHGLLANTCFDYQVSVFRLAVADKLTQLSGVDPISRTAYTYWANTGKQLNQGAEVSFGYLWTLKKNPVLERIVPFVSSSFYDFRYTDFKTKIGTAMTDFSSKQVVGVPKTKFTAGLDIMSPQGCYLNNTFNYLGDVYTDFDNANQVKSVTQYNAKFGYKHSFLKSRLGLDLYVAGNNLTNQINYTFLFLGNSINDSDKGSNYPAGVATDVNPGPGKAYFWSGFSAKYRF